MTGPAFTFGEARDAVNAEKAAQAAAEDFRRQASRALADAEQAYRVALASEIVRQHDAGVAWTVAKDLARGAEPVALLRHKRDIAAGVLDAAETAAWRHNANRRALDKLVEWSMRRDLAEGAGTVAVPPESAMETFGGRRAA